MIPNLGAALEKRAALSIYNLESSPSVFLFFSCSAQMLLRICGTCTFSSYASHSGAGNMLTGVDDRGAVSLNPVIVIPTMGTNTIIQISVLSTPHPVSAATPKRKRIFDSPLSPGRWSCDLDRRDLIFNSKRGDGEIMR